MFFLQILGKKFAFFIDLNSTITLFKKMITIQFQIFNFRLFYAGNLLDDQNNTLAQYNIQKESTIQCVLLNSPNFSVFIPTLDKICLNEILSYNTLTLSKCPNCEFYFEKIFDDYKNNLSNYFICPYCCKSFCFSCQSVPYHYSLSCDNFQKILVSKKCRFCQKIITDPSIKYNICGEIQCVLKFSMNCQKVLPCGHLCYGIRGEDENDCCSCISQLCKPQNSQDENSPCTICYDPLYTESCVFLSPCEHIFHFNCVKYLLINWKTPGKPLNFSVLNCPLCSSRFYCPQLLPFLQPILELWNLVSPLAIRTILEEKKQLTPSSQVISSASELSLSMEEDINMDINSFPTSLPLSSQNSQQYLDFNDETLRFAFSVLVFFLCNVCEKPFCGGHQQCQVELIEEKSEKPSQIICPSCLIVQTNQKQQSSKILGLCKKPEHAQFVIFKCRFCCSVSSYFCWGTHHICQFCHSHEFTLRKEGRAQGQIERSQCPPTWSFSKVNQSLRCPLGLPKGSHCNGVKDDCELPLYCSLCHPDWLSSTYQTQNKDTPEEVVLKGKSWCYKCGKTCTYNKRYKCSDCPHFGSDHLTPDNVPRHQRRSTCTEINNEILMAEKKL